MKAVVMAGGEGARLRPLTSRLPKPLVPVVGTPVLEHILRLLKEHGITQVVVTLAYLGAEIRNRLGDGAELDMEIEYVVEDRPLGTAGSVRNAAHLLDDTFLVISGDALTDIDLTKVMRAHEERGSHATIVLHSVPNPLEYGVVVTDDEGNIKRFLEKPSWGEVFSDHANTGIYVIEPKVLEHIKEGANADWSQDVFPTMLRRHEPLHGIVVDDYWCDIGSIQSYMQANWDALDGKVRCHIPGRRQGNVWMGEGVEIGIGVQLDGPAFIGDEVKLKGGAHINEHGVIDRYSVIDDNTKVSNSVVWPHSYIGERCRLRQAIVCRNVTIKNNSLLEENSVIADECVLGRGSQIRAGVKIWPSKTVEPGSTVNESVIWAGEWRSGLFSSYGLGGLINVELTPEFCARLGAAFGATLAKGACVVVGPGPRALVADDQARDRQRHRQCRCQGARRSRAAGAGDAVGDARRGLRGGDPRARVTARSAQRRHPVLRQRRSADRQARRAQAREPALPRGLPPRRLLRDGRHRVRRADSRIHPASLQVRGRGEHSQRRLPRADRLRLQRRFSGAPDASSTSSASPRFRSTPGCARASTIAPCRTRRR